MKKIQCGSWIYREVEKYMSQESDWDIQLKILNESTKVII